MRLISLFVAKWCKENDMFHDTTRPALSLFVSLWHHYCCLTTCEPNRAANAKVLFNARLRSITPHYSVLQCVLLSTNWCSVTAGMSRRAVVGQRSCGDFYGHLTFPLWMTLLSLTLGSIRKLVKIKRGMTYNSASKPWTVWKGQVWVCHRQAAVRKQSEVNRHHHRLWGFQLLREDAMFHTALRSGWAEDCPFSSSAPATFKHGIGGR